MHPQKVRPFLMHVQPCQGSPYHLASTTFDCLVAVFSLVPAMEAGIVGVESTIKAGSGARRRVEDQRSDKRRRVIPVASENIRSIREVLRQGHCEIIDLVKLRIRSRQDCGMRSRG